MKNLSTWIVAFIFIIILAFIAYVSIKFIEKKKINDLLEKFPNLKKSIIIFPPYYTRLRVIVYIIFLFLSLISLLNPSFEEEKVNENLDLKGVDILFMVDVSLSMNAEENGITRLSRFKESVLSTLPSLAGNRFGMITFAGTPFLYCPMTSDPGAFSDYVRGIETDMIPDTGTNIKKAFEKSEEMLKSSKVYRNRILVLATDGEDMKETFPSDPSADLIILGIGSTEGSFIRYKDETTGLSGFITKEGKLSGDVNDPMLIKSALNEEYLKKLAFKFNSEYVNVTRNPGGADVIREKVSKMEKNTEKVLQNISKKDGYQYFLLPALIFLFIDLTLLEIYAKKGK
jgi:Ca-activated chloride channel family protein